MAKKKNRKPVSDAAVFLGQSIMKLRTKRGMTRAQLGKIINETEQQVVLFESGELVPLSTLEAIGLALDFTIQKKFIRKISDLRHMEKVQGFDHPELLDWYRAAFADEDEA